VPGNSLDDEHSVQRFVDTFQQPGQQFRRHAGQWWKCSAALRAALRKADSRARSQASLRNVATPRAAAFRGATIRDAVSIALGSRPAM